MTKKILRYFGIQEESVYGTAVDAILHLDISGCTLDAPANTTIPFKGGMGRSLGLWRPDFYSPAGNMDYAPDLRSIGYFLKWALGEYVYTAAAPEDFADTDDKLGGGNTTIAVGHAASIGDKTVYLTAGTNFDTGDVIRIGAPRKATTEYRELTAFNAETSVGSFSVGLVRAHSAGTSVVEIEELPTPVTEHLHEIYGTDNYDLPSFTARVGKDQFEHTFMGCKINSLNFKVDSGLARCTIGMNARKDQKDILKELDALVIPAEVPIAYYEVEAYIDTPETNISQKVKSLELSIKNAINPTNSKTIGSRYANYLYAGDRETTINLTMTFDDMDMLEKYWGSTIGPDDTGSTEFPMVIKIDTAYTDSLQFKIPRALLTGVTTTASGRDLITQNVTLLALMDQDVTLDDGVTNVATEILATLYNQNTTMNVI